MKQAINTRTQEEYDALMRYYESNGITAPEGKKASLMNFWPIHQVNTSVLIEGGIFVVGNSQYHKAIGIPIIPYTEFAKANIVEEKRKLTREAAYAFLNEKFLYINEETLQTVVDKLKEIGFRQDGYPTFKDKVLLIDVTEYSCSFSTHQIVIGDYTELQLSDLLSIDIIESQDYKALYLEGRKLLEEVRGYMTAHIPEKVHDKVDQFLTKHNDLTNHKDGE